MGGRIAIVANKWWEFDPILGVLLSDYVRPPDLGWPVLLRHPRPRPDRTQLPSTDPNPYPRAVFSVGTNRVRTELWCISDLLEHLPDPSPAQSSSEQKARRLPAVVSGGAPDLTIAIGSAARGSDISYNGQVVLGTKAFLFNGHPGNPDSNWTAGPFGQVLTSEVSRQFFSTVLPDDAATRNRIQSRFLVSPLNPSPAAIIADFDAVALGDVNVTDPSEYGRCDTATVTAFQNLQPSEVFGSLETTHGLIRAVCGAKFMFISGVANRVGHYADEVIPHMYGQNTVAAHNAGVVLAWVLPQIADTIA